MSKLIAILATAGLVAALNGVAKAGQGNCNCQSHSAAAQAAPQQQAAPPAAPGVGQTQQSQSVQPLSAPPAAPRTGATYRNYSVQPAPSPRLSPRSMGRRPYNPEQRLRPSNRLM